MVIEIMLEMLSTPRTHTFEGVLLLIIALSALTSLVSLKRTTANLLLFAFFASVVLMSLSRILEGTIVGFLFPQLQDTFLILSGLFLTQFAYHFPAYDQPRESRLALSIFSLFLLLAVGTILSEAIAVYGNSENILTAPEYFWYLMPLAFLVAIFLCLRRTLYYAGPAPESGAGWRTRLAHTLKAIWHPPNKAASFQQNLALAISIGGIQAFVSMGLIGGLWGNYLVATSGLLCLAGVALVFYNHTSETISFMTKLVGISLTGLLVFMGIAGIHTIETERFQQLESFTLPFEAVQANIVQPSGSKIPPSSVSYIVSWPAPTDFQLADLEIHYLGDDVQADDLLSVQSLGGPINQIWWENGFVIGFVGGQPRDFYRRRFEFDGRIYEVGFPWSEYARPILRELYKYILLTLSGAFFILTLFPLFFRRHLFAPLDNLLQGVNQADQGQLDINLPVYYQDEIGSITGSFNQMASSLRQSNDHRDQYFAELTKTNKALTEEIKEREMAQQAQDLSEQKYRTVVEMGTQGIMVIQDGQRVYHNPAWLDMIGYSAEEYDAIPFPSLVYADDLGLVRAAFQKLTEGQEIETLPDIRVTTRSGVIKWVSARGTQIEWEGQPAGMIFIKDISRRKQLELELRLNRDQLAERIAERTRQLSAFLDMTMLVSEAGNLADVIDVVLNRIMEICQCQSLALHLFNDDQTSLTLLSQRGLSIAQQEKLQTVPLEPPLKRWLSQRHEPLLMLGSVDSAHLTASLQLDGLPVYMGTQLRAREYILGMLSYYRTIEQTFSVDEISLLAALAEQLAIVIENDRLRSQIEELAVITERQRLARDLHDSINQSLYSINLFTHAAREASEDSDPIRLADRLTRIETITLDALKSMRLLLYQLQPDILAEKGLVEALRLRLDTVEGRLGIEVDYRVEGQVNLPPDIAEALYWAATETLNNSLKHAGASRLTLHLKMLEPVIELKIVDNGHGFETARNSAGMGLKNIRQRLEELNGCFNISSAIGAGTTAELAVRVDGEPAKARTQQ